jgi:hypothetical protein
MKNGLLRTRIKGMSFRSGIASSRSCNRQTKDPQNALDAFSEDPQKGAPPPLTRSDIRRLLQDLGRQELHTLMNESITHGSHWRQVSSMLEKRTEESFFDDPRQHGATLGSEESSQRRADVLVLVKRNFRLWNHRIEMLEWIAKAQHTIQRETAQRRDRSYR